ncbi:MAG: helicase [Burkholderiales bacterium PBB3]|nr:MAG: helicase [Burkholderiales bacterium PBB3]
MQTLSDAVLAVFSEDGPLQNAIPSFVSRPGQNHLAVEIAKTVQSGGLLVAEAGTGIGKTFAYLVPILLSGQRALISTATKALQDQLAKRDLPRIQSALKTPVRVHVLKGRSSYVCLHRLESARQQANRVPQGLVFQLARVEAWSAVTRSGDLAEITDFPEQTELARWVTSTQNNCLGSSCPRAAGCFVNLARREALVAEVVIINHHLFFSDMRARESGVFELLPSVTTVVFDEAHRLNDIGVQFLGQQFSSQSVEYFCRDVLAYGAVLTLGAADWRAWVNTIVQSTGNIRTLLSKVVNPEDLLWDESIQAPQGVDRDDWAYPIEKLRVALKQISSLLHHLASAAPEMSALGRRADELSDALDALSGPTPLGNVKWVDLGQTMTWACGPIQIREAMQAQLKSSADTLEAKRSWIFTSATLGYEAGLTFFTESCGLDDARVLRVESPFDYASQASLYIPQDFPAPSDPMHSLEVAHLVAQAAGILRGRTLVLVTTRRAMEDIGLALRKHFLVRSDLRVVFQGDVSKTEILRLLAAAASGGQQGVVVVATTSFWEGVDLPGDAVQMVVIDKIPFAPPDSPLIRARVAQLTAAGKRPFLDLHLPMAAMALKQGAGRLIRAETDQGLLVICDTRLMSMGYGKKILSELPKMARITERDQWITALHQLTKFSTTDPY